MLTVKDRVKIVATLGPTTDIAGMLAAGVDVFRLNFSHGDREWHAQNVAAIRSMAKVDNVAIMVDLQGPKIRITEFDAGSALFVDGAAVTVGFSACAKCTNENIYLACEPKVFAKISKGDRLLLDDGKVAMEVLSRDDAHLQCLVVTGGILSNRKGISVLNGGLILPAITVKDRQDIEFIRSLDIDFIALSFVSTAADIVNLRQLLQGFARVPKIMAKIETATAITNHKEIIAAADGIMVARGDLAVEVGAKKVPWLQKQLLATASLLKKPAIVATQMMESMIKASSPTRAEVSDVANAILDGADAVMLSAETAIGVAPNNVVKNVAEICLEANSHERIFINDGFANLANVQQVIAWSAVQAAHKLQVDWLVALTETGDTALLFSKFGIDLPILGLSRNVTALAHMTMYKNVTPIYFDFLNCVDNLQQAIVKHLQELNIIGKGNTIILTNGGSLGIVGATNSMTILEV